MSSDRWRDLSGALAGVCNAFSQDQETHSGFLPRSPAAAEVANEPYADTWGSTPARNANMAGLYLAIVALDQLACLAVLLRSETGHGYGLSAMARSAMEVAARGHYLLDPDVESLERIRRQQNERLVALSEQKRLATTAKSVDANALDARIKEILGSAHRKGLDPRPKAKPPMIAPGPPSATDLINDAVGQGNGLGAIYYQTMSAVAHGREHGITQNFTRQGALLDRTHGDVFGSFGTTPKQAAQSLCGTPLAVFNMLDRLYSRFGWPTNHIQAPAQQMLTVWKAIAAMA